MQSVSESLFVKETPKTRSQHGALCWRLRRRTLQVLLVTSRDTGRWVIPKGWPHEGLDAAGSATREAWEEAGVEGAADPHCLGLFSYDKCRAPLESLPCVVSVYGLRVKRLSRRFPERHERRRKWFSVEDAAKRVAEPELRALMLAAKDTLPGAERGQPSGAAPASAVAKPPKGL